MTAIIRYGWQSRFIKCTRMMFKYVYVRHGEHLVCHRQPIYFLVHVLRRSTREPKRGKGGEKVVSVFIFIFPKTSCPNRIQFISLRRYLFDHWKNKAMKSERRRTEFWGNFLVRRNEISLTMALITKQIFVVNATSFKVKRAIRRRVADYNFAITRLLTAGCDAYLKLVSDFAFNPFW